MMQTYRAVKKERFSAIFFKFEIILPDTIGTLEKFGKNCITDLLTNC